MSGTEENTKVQSGTEQQQNNADNQSGTDLNAEIQSLKEQISDLRKEAAKYRTTAKATATEKQTVEEQLKALQDEFAKTKKETFENMTNNLKKSKEEQAETQICYNIDIENLEK